MKRNQVYYTTFYDLEISGYIETSLKLRLKVAYATLSLQNLEIRLMSNFSN